MGDLKFILDPESDSMIMFTVKGFSYKKKANHSPIFANSRVKATFTLSPILTQTLTPECSDPNLSLLNEVCLYIKL